jgi:hypothetical protein
MNHLLRSIEASLTTGNAYAALAMTLALPDICGWLLDPSVTSSKLRYVRWFDRYVTNYYINFGIPYPFMPFLSGNDCYALRCAFLHEGREDISTQRAQELLDTFQFTVAPSQDSQFHHNLFGTKLQLQVDLFCKQIIMAVTQFQKEVSANPEVMERMGSLLRIRDINGNVID